MLGDSDGGPHRRMFPFETGATPAEEKRESGLVEISVEAQKHFGMQVEAAQVHELNEYLQVPGTVQPIDSHVNTVRPLARGRLHDVLVRVGDRVAERTTACHLRQHGGRRTGSAACGRQGRVWSGCSGRSETWPARRTVLAPSRRSGQCPRRSLNRPARNSRAAQQSIKSQESVIAGILARLQRFGISQTDIQSTPGHYNHLSNGRRRNQAGGVARRSHRIVVCAVHDRGPLLSLGAGRSVRKGFGTRSVGQSALDHSGHIRQSAVHRQGHVCQRFSGPADTHGQSAMRGSRMRTCA